MSFRLNTWAASSSSCDTSLPSMPDFTTSDTKVHMYCTVSLALLASFLLVPSRMKATPWSRTSKQICLCVSKSHSNLSAECDIRPAMLLQRSKRTSWSTCNLKMRARICTSKLS